MKQPGLAEGLRGVFARWQARLQPQRPDPEAAWKSGIASEVKFWDDYFRTGGLQWSASYGVRLDPTTPLQPRVVALLPSQPEVCILDVGAGPLTALGKVAAGRRITITAVDPLADAYDRILEKYGVQPLVRSQACAGEELSGRFAAGSFDLVFARNCIDHSYDPERAILQMVQVVRPGHHVLLEHRPNEAEHEGYAGLHQWNFSASPTGDFLITSKTTSVNFTQKHAGICTVTCEMAEEPGDGHWLVTRLQKK